MRPAYGAEEIGIGGHPVTIVVDVANVMGSRPDGWWRDRSGAAVRLYDQITRLAASGRATPPDDARPPGSAERPGFVMVLEGAAKAAAARVSSGEPAPPGPAQPGHGGTAAAGPPRPGEVRVVRARGSGDDAIVAVVRELPGRRVVVTADRELRARVTAAGATVAGPGWLLGLLKN